MKFWRILKYNYKANAFDGLGASIVGGRWNSKGHRVVYCSSNKSLSVVEMLYAIGGLDLVPSDYISIPVDVPFDIALKSVQPDDLREDWHNHPAPSYLQEIGDNWIQSKSSCILKVPSAAVHGEFNYLINPEHDDFKKLILGNAESVFYHQLPFIQRKPMSDLDYRDVFICHASEDKEHVVEPIVKELNKASISYWFDKAEVKWGDSVVEKVNDGLRSSRYAIVVFSPNFMAKNWPQRELNAVLNIEASSGRTLVLPLMVGNDEEIEATRNAFPLQNDKLYLRWNNDPKVIVSALADRLSDF